MRGSFIFWFQVLFIDDDVMPTSLESRSFENKVFVTMVAWTLCTHGRRRFLFVRKFVCVLAPLAEVVRFLDRYVGYVVGGSSNSGRNTRRNGNQPWLVWLWLYRGDLFCSVVASIGDSLLSVTFHRFV